MPRRRAASDDDDDYEAADVADEQSEEESDAEDDSSDDSGFVRRRKGKKKVLAKKKATAAKRPRKSKAAAAAGRGEGGDDDLIEILDSGSDADAGGEENAATPKGKDEWWKKQLTELEEYESDSEDEVRQCLLCVCISVSRVVPFRANLAVTSVGARRRDGRGKCCDSTRRRMH